MLTKIKALKDQLFERTDELQERARTWWSSLNQRERIILGSASAFFGALLVIFLARELSSLISDASDRARGLAEDGKKIQMLINQIVETRTQADRFDNLSSGGDNSSLKDFSDRQASRFGVALQSAKPGSTKSSLVEEGEETLEVQLAPDVSLSAALNYLEGVQSRLGVRLIHLRIMPNTTDRSKLKVEAMFAKKDYGAQQQ